jgi:hypothetical protein
MVCVIVIDSDGSDRDFERLSDVLSVKLSERLADIELEKLTLSVVLRVLVGVGVGGGVTVGLVVNEREAADTLNERVRLLLTDQLEVPNERLTVKESDTVELVVGVGAGVTVAV